MLGRLDVSGQIEHCPSRRASALVNFIGNAVATLFVGVWDRAVYSDRVRLGWGGVWLLGVGLRGREARLLGTVDSVFVPFGDGTVEVHGGRIALRGSPEVLEGGWLRRHRRVPLRVSRGVDAPATLR